MAVVGEREGPPGARAIDRRPLSFGCRMPIASGSHRPEAAGPPQGLDCQQSTHSETVAIAIFPPIYPGVCGGIVIRQYCSHDCEFALEIYALAKATGVHGVVPTDSTTPLNANSAMLTVFEESKIRSFEPAKIERQTYRSARKALTSRPNRTGCSTNVK